jgi:hypothetical protein
MSASTTQLFVTAAATANSGTLPVLGKRVHVYADGTWASSTIKLQFSPDGGTTWLDSGVSLSTSTKLGSAVAAEGVIARLALTVSGTTSLNAWVGFSDI